MDRVALLGDILKTSQINPRLSYPRANFISQVPKIDPSDREGLGNKGNTHPKRSSSQFLYIR